MRVEVDTDLCQGHAECVVHAPDVFAFGRGDDHVRILVEHPDESRRAAIEAAVRYCPTMALAIENE